MTLQDLENECLAALQSPLVNFGGAPSWGSLQGPQLSQAFVDHAINRGYLRVCNDLADVELVTTTITLASVLNAWQYTIPPTPASQPAIRMVRRVYYAPVGLNYSLELEPGARLISWEQYQRLTGGGYLQQTATATQPEVCAVSPDRKSLYFYPGASSAGDTITVAYAPIPTAGTSFPTLVAETDAPQLPDDCSEAIVYWALTLLWPKQREFGAVKLYEDKYRAEIQRLKDTFLRSSAGDKLRFADKGEVLSTSGFSPVWGGLYP